MGDAIHARSEGPRRAAVRGVGPRVLGDGVEAGAAVARPGRRRGRGCTGHHERAARPAVVDVRSKNIGGARPVSVETRPRIQSVKVVGARRRARAAASRPLLRSVERVAASDGSVPERAGRETELPRPSSSPRNIHVEGRGAAADPSPRNIHVEGRGGAAIHQRNIRAAKGRQHLLRQERPAAPEDRLQVQREAHAAVRLLSRVRRRIREARRVRERRELRAFSFAQHAAEHVPAPTELGGTVRPTFAGAPPASREYAAASREYAARLEGTRRPLRGNTTPASREFSARFEGIRRAAAGTRRGRPRRRPASRRRPRPTSAPRRTRARRRRRPRAATRRARGSAAPASRVSEPPRV